MIIIIGVLKIQAEDALYGVFNDGSIIWFPSGKLMILKLNIFISSLMLFLYHDIRYVSAAFKESFYGTEFDNFSACIGKSLFISTIKRLWPYILYSRSNYLQICI